MSERFEATDAEMKRRKRLADRVGSELALAERESTMSHRGQDDVIQITTYAVAWVGSLLKHRHAKIKWVYVHRGDSPGGRVDSVADALDEPRSTVIEGLCAEIPVGCLTVKGTVRADDRMGGVITTPAKAEKTAEYFSEESQAESD